MGKRITAMPCDPDTRPDMRGGGLGAGRLTGPLSCPAGQVAAIRRRGTLIDIVH